MVPDPCAETQRSANLLRTNIWVLTLFNATEGWVVLAPPTNRPQPSRSSPSTGRPWRQKTWNMTNWGVSLADGSFDKGTKRVILLELLKERASGLILPDPEWWGGVTDTCEKQWLSGSAFLQNVLIDSPDAELLFGMLSPVAPLLQCYLHHQRLSIADVIIIFCRRRHRGGASAPSWSVGKGKLPLLISRINFKYKLELCARHLEDEYRGEPQSEDMKSLIHCRGRLEGGLSGCQGCAGGCQTTVVEHEMAIKEVWELLLEVRGWPRGDRKPLLDPFEFCLLTQWNPKKETEDVWNLLFSLDKKWILLQKTLVWMWKISSFWFSEKIKVLIQAPVIYTRPQGFVHLNKKRGEEEGQRMPAAKALVILVSVAILLRWTVSKDGRVGCVPGRRSVTQP